MKRNLFIVFKSLIICLILSIYLISGLLAKQRLVYVAKIEDATINPITAEYIKDAIETAAKEEAECLVIEFDTPGGLLASTRLIVKNIMTSEVPVVVYVYPSGSRAGSAGVFITLSAHIAAMSPSTNIGAAHPVRMGEKRTIWDALRDLMDSRNKKSKGAKQKKPLSSDETLQEKILQDTLAFIRGIAKERHRNIKWAEKSVLQSASITEMEALKKDVIDIVAKDEEELLSKIDGKTVVLHSGAKKTLHTKEAEIIYFDMNARQRILNVLVNPNIAYILLLLGFYGLLFEVTHPGIGFPGIAGAICLILAFFGMQTLPTNYAGLALIILGIILFIAEANVSGFGLLTLGGLVCMVLGSLILFESPYQIGRVSLKLILSFSVTTAAITLFLVSAVVRTHRKKVLSGKEGIIGLVGEVSSDITPQAPGKVFVHGELWKAESEQSVKKGEEVKVIGIDGMTLKVSRVVKQK